MSDFNVPGDFDTVALALAAVDPNIPNTIILGDGYGPENVAISINDITITGPLSAEGIVLTLQDGVSGLVLAGSAPISVFDLVGNDNNIAGNDGDNTITVTGGQDTISGGLGDDRAFVDYSQATTAPITGTAGTISSSLGTTAMSGFEHYTVLTGASADTLTFGSGNNYLDTGVGVSTVVLGNGNNTVLSGNDADTITVGTGSNKIAAGDGVNTIVATGVGFGDNIISGGTGADTISVGHGNNHITGGEGVDTGLDTFVAGNGNNCIDGGDGAKNAITVGNGNNYLLGGDGVDLITAGNGNNFVDAGEGLNAVTAGTGDNYIVVGDLDDVVTAMGGENNVQTGGGKNAVTTGTGNDVVETGTGNDTVTVGTGENIVKVVGGTDVLTAGADNDRLIVDYSAYDTTVVSALTGAATYGGTIGDVTLTSFEEFHVTTGSADDNIETFDGADVLDGGAGADTLTSGEGNDVIYGDDGDVVDGGEDVDNADFDVLVVEGLGFTDIVYDLSADPTATDSEIGTVNQYDVEGGTLLGSVDFTGIEHIQVGDKTVVTPEDTQLNGNLFVLDMNVTKTVTSFTVGNNTITVGDTAERPEGDLTINSDGSYTFEPTLNYHGPGPVISYTFEAVQITDGLSSTETVPLIIEVVSVEEVIPECLKPVCFVQGTMIASAKGEVPVEDLNVGDLIQTMDRGFQRIRWVGNSYLSAQDLNKNKNLRPIRISKVAVIPESCVGELVVSPQHRLLIASKVSERMFGNTEVLIAAKQLLAIDGVDIANDFVDVKYYHILFDQHEIIFADGIPAESLYLGLEAQKSLCAAGREEIMALFPKFLLLSFLPNSCRPIIHGKKARKLANRLYNNCKPLVDEQLTYV
ncbi:MAG: Ca2+-binding RTX toxin-like protein [Alteromonas macleodii]|jgi:Ca2+-binding RTX toxin-like protein